MDRTKRIRVAVVATAGLTALFVAYVVLALIAIRSLPSTSGDAAEVIQAFSQFSHTTTWINRTALACIVFAFGCGVYLFVAWLGWFVGPAGDAKESGKEAVAESV